MNKLLSRKFILGTTIGAALFFMLAGVIFWGGFNTAMEATNTMEFCISCHEMEDNVYQEYKQTIHYKNRSGVQATCSDCHVPDPWVHKIVRKIQASNEVFHKILGSIDTPEKFDGKRLQLANNVWKSMKKTDSRECRNCHDFTTMQPDQQKARSRKQHLNGMTAGNTCIDCHKGIAHKNVHDQLSEEELDKLSTPNPANAIPVPQHWQEFLEREAQQKQADKEAAAEAAKQAAEAAAATATAAAGNTAAAAGNSAVNWVAIPSKEVTLFFPGQASIEWIVGRRHGGKRSFTTGDRCLECHEEEVADLGEILVKGESDKKGLKDDPSVIPGKRGSIPVTIQTAHDANNLYMRFEWEDTVHTPAPFADGGKMDPENPMKLALMIATDDPEYADRAGCWGTCHADLNSMPFAPEGQHVTKYIAESRTEIELKGRSKPLGGWDKRKADDDIKAEFDAGHFMDLLRYKSGEQQSENGHILADRELTAGDEFTARKEGNKWIVELTRPLKGNGAGDIELATDKLYNIGFAIHEDYSNARFHHVSLGYKLGFNNDEAEINAIAQ